MEVMDKNVVANEFNDFSNSVTSKIDTNRDYSTHFELLTFLHRRLSF